MEWWLVRHGLTKLNLEKRYQGHLDEGLLREGLPSLHPLKGQLEGVQFSKVYCSDLLRCRETLRYVRPDLEHAGQCDARLRETSFGDWEGKTYEMLKDNPHYREWIEDPRTVTPPEGESWGEFSSRIQEFYNELLHVSEQLCKEGVAAPILLVTHGGVISMISMIHQPGTGFWDHSVPPGGLHILKII